MELGNVGSTAEELKIIRRTLVVKTALELRLYYKSIGVSRDLSECIKEITKYNNDATKNDYWSWYEG